MSDQDTEEDLFLTEAKKDKTPLGQKIEAILRIQGQAIFVTNHKVGQEVADVINDEANGGSVYGKGAVKKIEEATGISNSNLYLCRSFAMAFTEQECQEIFSSPNINWTHVKACMSIKDHEKRKRMLLDLHEDPMTTREFDDLVKAENKQDEIPEGEDGGTDPDMGSAPTGPTDGSSSSSSDVKNPLKAVKTADKALEKLNDLIGTATIAIRSFEAESTSADDRFTGEVEQLVGGLAGVLPAAVGLAKVAEEFMAHRPNKQRKTSAKARSGAYSQAAKASRGLELDVSTGALGNPAPEPEPKPTPKAKPKSKAVPPKEAKKTNPQVVQAETISSEEAREIDATDTTAKSDLQAKAAEARARLSQGK